LEPGGRPLPDFVLVAKLGEGGFGEVWKAQGSGGFAVALKFIRLGGKAGGVELRALEVMKDIRHPHLLVMFGAWEKDGTLIVAMELADGTLLDRLNEAHRQGLPGIQQPELLEYMREAAKGIDHLNAIPVQHRDVKPQNLLLVGGGVKVADFGLAKLMQHTLSGHTGGYTPAYVAPEFLNGQVSRQSDQYAQGVSYCQLRGGRLPFTGPLAQILTGHLMHPPDLSMIPQEQERLAVARALAKEPEERWPSCRAFVEALVAPVRVRVERDIPPMSPPTPAGLGTGPLLLDLGRGVKLELVYIKEGELWMGAPDGEKEALDDEKPRHRVAITKPFWLGKYAVTQQQYTCLTGKDNPSFFAPTGDGKDRVQKLDTSRFPVENLSWDDATAFCEELNRKHLGQVPEALRRAGYKFGLPTEAQWEYACRAGTQTPFHFGEELNGEQANCDGNYPYGTAAKGPYLERTCRVGSYEANAFGLYDMQGNVWQWCADYYDPKFYNTRPVEDPLNNKKGAEDRRVLRGGSWIDRARRCRAACRFRWYHPADRNNIIGFRVAFRLD
jgi:formylglycine-generating enzyme required for sulfatase activity